MRVYNRDTGETYYVDYDDYEDYGGGGGSFSEFLYNLLLRLIALGLILGLTKLLFGLLVDTLTDNGILKTKIVAYWDVSDDRGIDMENVQLVFVSMNEVNGEYNEYSYSFDTKKESCQLKLLKGEYAIYYEYDGEKFSIQSFQASGLGKYKLTIDDIFLIRIAQITFWNDDGDLLYPEQISIVDDEGDKQSIDLLENGKYSVVLNNDCGEIKWTISAIGYESKEITFDGETDRVLDIGVVLHENQ